MTKNYKAEIIAVGTELLLGQIANTNAQWLSDKLANYGINVFFHSVVGDNLERVKSTFEIAGKRSDIIFVTGGLGPTEDDLTREAFQAISGKTIKEDKVTLAKVASYFEKNNRAMTPNNRKQAHVFDDAIVLPNSTGMAPGMIVDYSGSLWVFLPGVPREMKAISQEHVFPYLKKTLQLNTVIYSRMLRFIGIGESQIEHELKDIIANQHNPTIAPLASEGEVGIRITSKSETEEKAIQLIENVEKMIQERVGQYFYGYDEESISDKVFQLLKDKKFTIAAAESLTGGKFSDELVSKTGASDVFVGSVVCYSVFAKENMLGVSNNTIDKYGTVSAECAQEMAKGVRENLTSTIGISFTGVAGPDPVEQKPVGTVFIAIQFNNKTVVKEFHFQGNREAVRSRVIKKGFELLHDILLER